MKGRERERAGEIINFLFACDLNGAKIEFRLVIVRERSIGKREFIIIIRTARLDAPLSRLRAVKIFHAACQRLIGSRIRNITQIPASRCDYLQRAGLASIIGVISPSTSFAPLFFFSLRTTALVQLFPPVRGGSISPRLSARCNCVYAPSCGALFRAIITRTSLNPAGKHDIFYRRVMAIA